MAEPHKKLGDKMTIGIPKALLYYRYEKLWQTFFTQLGCEVKVSPDTCPTLLEEGISQSVGECCLPVKLFLGHVAALVGECDRILVPRFETTRKGEEFCVRLWGLPDLVRNTFPGVELIGYNLQGHLRDSQRKGFVAMGTRLGNSRGRTLDAYRTALEEQVRQDRLAEARQRKLMDSPGPKILLVAQPYLIHDAYMGTPLVRLLRELGAIPLFSDRCSRAACHARSKALCTDLYWTLNREMIGSIPLLKGQVDGVLLITAFPCGTDSLVNELVLRRVTGVPIAQLVLDEQQGDAGLRTRIECFLDMVWDRRDSHAG